eukprot:scaffold40315_cov226-Skeletonema_marinoi.AAC.8
MPKISHDLLDAFVSREKARCCSYHISYQRQLSSIIRELIRIGVSNKQPADLPTMLPNSDSRYRKDGGSNANRNKALFCCAALALSLASIKLSGTNRFLAISNAAAEDDLIKAETFSFDLTDEENDITDTTPLFDSSFAEYLKKGLSWYVANAGNKHFFYPDSNFHKTWPKADIPYWTKKRFPLNKYITPGKQTCFMHVGKAGGSTIGCLLGFSLHCDTNNQTVTSLLAATTAHATHRCVHDCSDEAAYNLFVVRDPLTRALSAFNYGKQKLLEKNSTSKGWVRDKELIFDCEFASLNDLAERGLVKDSHNATEECRVRAKNALLGTETSLIHWYYNYQYYYEMVSPDANIVVIRNEHIVDDWNAVETLLGGDADFTQEHVPVNNAREKKPEEVYLSDAAKVVLCETLCNEIQVYKTILKRAQNIKNEQYVQSMQELVTSCPKEAMEESCPDAKPDIREKVDGCY